MDRTIEPGRHRFTCTGTATCAKRNGGPMSRLDRHVALVKNKLTLGKLLTALAWSLLVYGCVVWVAILLNRAFGLRLPRPWIFFWSGTGAAVAVAIGYALLHRPTRRE